MRRFTYLINTRLRKMTAILLCFMLLASFVNLSLILSSTKNLFAMADSAVSQEHGVSTLSGHVSTKTAKTKYQVVFDFDGGRIGTDDDPKYSNEYSGYDFENYVEIPVREYYAFYGYFSEKNANGTRYYDWNGRLLDGIDLNETTPSTLYAAWVKTFSAVYTYDGDSIRIDESNGHRHSSYKYVGLDIAKLKEIGYNKIQINMDIEIRAQDKGDGRDMWFDLYTNGSYTFTHDLLDNADLQETSWYSHYATTFIEIGKFDNGSQFRFGFYQTKSYFWTDAIWWFNDSNCYFTATDRTINDPLTKSYESLKTNSYTLDDNSGYNISNKTPNGNPLGGNYANIGVRFNGGSLVKGNEANGIQRYGYVIDNKYNERDAISLELLLKYNYQSTKNINGTLYEISQDSYSGAINGITGAGVVQTGTVLVQKLKNGGNPNNSSDWTWQNPVNDGRVQSFHTSDFTENFKPSDFHGESKYITRIAPVVKRDANGNFIYKLDENGNKVDVEYAKDSNDNYAFQEVYQLTDGYLPIYTPSGSELLSGTTLKIIFVYELKWSTTEWRTAYDYNTGYSYQVPYTVWHYTNVAEETLVSIYPATAKILFQNMDFNSYANDEDAQASEAGKSQLLRDFGTVLDGHAVNDGFRVNFKGNTTYTVEYYKDGATNELDKKYATDDQVFEVPGKYKFRVIPVVGNAVETTIFINDRGISYNLNKYFGKNLIDENSKRIYSQTDAIPVYLAGQTYWSTVEYNENSAPLIGRIGLSIARQTEYKEKRLDEKGDKYYVNYIIYEDEILYEGEGYFTQEIQGVKAFFKIVEHVNATDRTPKNGTLSETGYYYCEFANNKDYFGGQTSGDVYVFTFQFRLTTAVTKPSVNKQLLSGNISFADLNSRYYAVDIPTAEDGVFVTYAFNNATNAYQFAYSYERSLVEIDGDTYRYHDLETKSQAEILAKVEEISRISAKVRYFDASDVNSILTLNSTVNCEIDAGGNAILYIREAVKDESDKITGYQNIGTVNLTRSVIVFDDSFESSDYIAGDPFLNNKPYSYLTENGVVKSGVNYVRFIQVAEYESNKVTLTHVDSGLNWTIPYGVPVEEFLITENAPSGKYLIRENNPYMYSEYYGIYIQPGDNRTELTITRVEGKNQTTQVLSKPHANMRFPNINGLILNSATNDLDPYCIIKVINIETNQVEYICQLDELADYKLEKQGHYEIQVVDRLCNKIVFYADIYDATKFYSLTLENNGSVLNTINVGGGTRVNLPTPSALNSVVEFAGWRDESGNLIKDNYFYYGYAKNMTLTAVWHYKTTTVDLYDGTLLKSYSTKPDAKLELEDLYGTTKDGLTYFRYVYENESGAKQFYLPEMQSVPNAQIIRLDTLWKDTHNPLTVHYGDTLTPASKAGYVFYGYIYGNDTLFHDVVDVQIDGDITVYALYIVDPNYVAPQDQGFVAGITAFFTGVGEFFAGLSKSSIVNAFLGLCALAIVAFAFMNLKKKKETGLLKQKIVFTPQVIEQKASTNINTMMHEKKAEPVGEIYMPVYTYAKKEYKPPFRFPKLTYKTFGISLISLMLVFVLAITFNQNILFAAKQSYEVHAQEVAIERQLEEYNNLLVTEHESREAERQANETYVVEVASLYDRVDQNFVVAAVVSDVSTSDEEDFLYVHIYMDLTSLGYDVIPATAHKANGDTITGFAFTEYNLIKDVGTNEVIISAGFVSFLYQSTSITLDDVYEGVYITENSATEDSTRFILKSNLKYDERHYVYNSNYVVYSVSDFAINLASQNNNIATHDLSLGYLYDFDLEQVIYDPLLGKPLEIAANSTIRGIDYDFAMEYYRTVIANQDQFGASVDSITMTAIDVAALNEFILSGQDESFFGLSPEQIYQIEAQLTTASFYYIDGITGTIQTIDAKTILDRYYAEAHKNDVTFLKALNWVLIGVQIVGGIVLICTGAGAVAGAMMLAGGVLGLVAELAGPQIQQICGGIGTAANGIGAVTIGIQLITKWPVGTIAGIICIGVGLATTFFGFNDITESIWGDNLIKDVWGMNEEAYRWTELGLNIASTVCTIVGGVLKTKLAKQNIPIQVTETVDGVQVTKQYNTYADFLKDYPDANLANIKYDGVAGKNGTYEWHHIVEQCEIKNAGLKPTDIYSKDNTISLGYDTHRDISKIYSSNIANLEKKGFGNVAKLFDGINPNQTVRAYMSSLNYAQQMQKGKDILKLLKVIL